MTDFNFLRIKWPKLAAIAADASRLVEVSPSSAISTMQNFCEWATDIALDLYDIETQNGITQQEKLETLRSTGAVPAEIIDRFNNLLVAGGRRVYRINEDVEEARLCIEDIYDIGRWLNKEADRVGWPPRRSDSYRSVMSTSLNYSDSGGGRGGGRAGGLASARPYLPVIGLGAAAVLIIVALVIGVSAWVRGNNNAKVDNVISATPSSAMLVTMPTDTPEPSPTPEVLVYVDTLEPAATPKTGRFFLKEWDLNDKTSKFAIADKEYDNGMGMFLPSKSVSSSGSDSIKFQLDGKYSRIRFDLGVDANLDYGEGYGTFRVRIYTDDDSTPVYDSENQEYDFTALGQDIDIKNCDVLKITLTEKKGSKGTINVVLGDLRLLKGASTGESASPEDNATPGDNDTSTPGDEETAKNDSTPDSDASPTATKKSTATKKATATPTTKATATPTNEDEGGSGDEQQPPP